MKVYVLVNEWVIDTCDSGACVRVFETLSHAQEQMWADAECWADYNLTDEWTRLEGNDSMSIEYCIEGYYTENHVRWFVTEQEVEVYESELTISN